MATPADLPDLTIGFGLTEGIIQSASEIEGLEVVPSQDGIELRTRLTPDNGRQFKKRQQRLTGPTGCGLCGVDLPWGLPQNGRVQCVGTTIPDSL